MAARIKSTASAAIELAERLGVETYLTADEFRTLLRISPATFERHLTAGVVPTPDMHTGIRRWKLSTVRRHLAGEKTAA